MRRARIVLFALLAAIAPMVAVAQTTVTLNATSGSNVIAQSYSASGGLTFDMGFFAEYLIVGGGGGGGGANSSFFGNGETAGGGGAGGLLTNVGTPLQITNAAYPVVVGAGGAGATTVARGSNGGPSSIFSGTAVGGGGGAGSSSGAGGNRNGAAGGSGGGGAHDGGAGSGGAGTPGQGNAGGAGVQADGTVGSGGGGGGASTSGTNGVGKVGGAGGAGAANSISGAIVHYAGGGGGGGGYGGANGAGGLGGGGTGRTSAGTANTGGGGGSGNFSGGSGVVIVRYQGPQAGTGGTVTSGTGTASGYTLHTFTTTGSSTFNLSGLNLGTRLSAKVTGVITGNGSLTYNGPGTLILSGNSTYSGSTTIAAGTLQLGDGSTQGAINSSAVLNNGTLVFNRGNALRFEAAVSGSGNVLQQGTGRTTLTGSSTYSGGTTINAGSVATTAANRLPTQGLVTVGGSTSLTLGGNQTLGGLAGSGTVAIGSFRLTLGSSSGTFAGSIQGTGGITKTGSGTLTLSGSNAFTGDTFVDGGTLALSNTRALDPFAIVTTGTGGTLQVNQNTRVGYYENNGSLTGSGTLTSAYTLTNSGTLGSPIADSGGASGVLKRTSGTSVLAAANTYTGPTRIDAGRLELGAGGSVAATSSLIVNPTGEFATNGASPTFSSVQNNGLLALAGGTTSITTLLSGTGTIDGSVTLTGLHSPGNSPGVEAITGNLAYGSGASVLWELADNTSANSPVAYDQITVGGDLAFDAATSLTLAFDAAGSLVDWDDAFWNTDHSWTIWDVAGSTTGFGDLALTGTDWLDGFGAALATARPDASFAIAQQGSDVVLTYTAVPEPATWTLALVACGIAAAAVARRRRTA